MDGLAKSNKQASKRTLSHSINALQYRVSSPAQVHVDDEHEHVCGLKHFKNTESSAQF
jgi:hypothetical protein